MLDDRLPGVVGLPDLPTVAGVRHSWVDTGRVVLHLAECGQGEAVVLVHGWAQHWYA